MDITHKYKNPPLTEAVFELFFNTNSWNATIPGLFFEKIKDRFPDIVQPQNGVGIEIGGNAFQIGGHNPDIIQYKNSSGNTIVQLSKNMLTVNKVPKYEGWEVFIDDILYVVSTLNSALSNVGATRMGLRYLNKMDIGKHSLSDFKKYFKIYPYGLPSDEEEKVNAINFLLEYPVVEDREFFSLQFATLRKEPNYNAPVHFDLYITRVKDIAELTNNYKDWLEKAHSLMNERFRSILTELSLKKIDDDNIN